MNSELERAIKTLEFNITKVEAALEKNSYIGIRNALDGKKRDFELAIALIRAEIEREGKTCEGCKHLPWKYDGSIGSIGCDSCSRGTILLDRYEEKGANK